MLSVDIINTMKGSEKALYRSRDKCQIYGRILDRQSAHARAAGKQTACVWSTNFLKPSVMEVRVSDKLLARL